jgi:hypothetical protein
MSDAEELHQKKTKALAKVRALNAAVLSIESDLTIAREQLIYWHISYKQIDHELALVARGA